MTTNESLVAVSGLIARALAGLSAGRIVHYVMRDGSVRPLLLVNTRDSSGEVNGVLLFDGPADNGNFPYTDTMPNAGSGHRETCVTWVPNIKYDDSDTPAPGTWHWPPQPRLATVADVQNAAQVTTATVATIEDVQVLHDGILDTVNAKLDAHLATVGAMLDARDAALLAPPQGTPTLDTAAFGGAGQAEPAATNSGTPTPAPEPAASGPLQSPPQPEPTPAEPAAEPAATEPAQ